MKLHTTNFGELEVNSDDIIIFPQGIPAFENLRKFIIIDHQEDSPFHYLQSVEEAQLTFVILEPGTFFPDYQVKLNKNDLTDIGIEDEKDAVVLLMVTIPAEPKNMTANLQAPLVFNGKRKLGKQVILSDSHYTTRHRLFPEEKLEACK
ncbi:MAG: flagellar assembly protein FliW [Bacillota bacterium]|nr:flagellar assembly protein FliW [Bacillota bacterium]